MNKERIVLKSKKNHTSYFVNSRYFFDQIFRKNLKKIGKNRVVHPIIIYLVLFLFLSVVVLTSATPLENFLNTTQESITIDTNTPPNLQKNSINNKLLFSDTISSHTQITSNGSTIPLDNATIYIPKEFYGPNLTNWNQKDTPTNLKTVLSLLLNTISTIKGQSIHIETTLTSQNNTPLADQIVNLHTYPITNSNAIYFLGNQVTNRYGIASFTWNTSPFEENTYLLNSSYLGNEQYNKNSATASIDIIAKKDESVEILNKSQGKAEINKPVQWKETIQITTTSIGQRDLHINIESTAHNIKIKNGKQALTRNSNAKEKEMFAFNFTTHSETFEISYTTESPIVFEEQLGPRKKRVKVNSPFPYTQILTYTTIPETAKDYIQVYHLKKEGKVAFENVIYLDTNQDGTIDQLQWYTPDMNNPTFEIELGLATVNTNKSLYHPNENVEISIVVLDKEGYLKDANVILQITDPSQNIYEYQELKRIQKGLYKQIFSVTMLEGDYHLYIEAQGNGVNDTMHSFFRVQSFYPFDIIRKTPLVIDPTKIQHSSLKILPYTSDQIFDLMEKIPKSFSIIDAKGAQTTSDANYWYLKWKNLNNAETVSYSFTTPLQSPALYTIGPVTINATHISFTEIKPWYLAVDPNEVLDPLVHVNTELASIDLTPTQVGFITTNDANYLDMNNGNGLSVELTNLTYEGYSLTDANCTLVYQLANGGTAQWEVRDSFGGNVVGSATLSTSAADNTVYLLNLQASGLAINEINNLTVYVNNTKTGGNKLLRIDDIECTIRYSAVPLVKNLTVVPETANQNQQVNISVNVTAQGDTTSSAIAMFELPNGSKFNQTLAALGVVGIYNTTFNQTNIIGSFNVTVWANGTDGGINNTVFKPFNVTASIDTTTPTTRLESPENNSFWANESVIFTYNVSDTSNIINCSLYIDGAFNQTNQSAVQKDMSGQNFSASLFLGSHNWSVNCTDAFNKINQSIWYNFSVQDSFSPTWSNNFSTPTSPTTYIKGQPYQFNVTWIDNVLVSSVIIEHNFTGSTTNYSVTGN